MHAVGDGVNAIPREHVPCRLGMAAADAVGIAGQVEGELRHIELLRTRELLEFPNLHQTWNKALEQIIAKPVVASLHGRVGGEHAAFAHLGEIVERLSRSRVRNAA
jgi:hypothetical protein